MTITVTQTHSSLRLISDLIGIYLLFQSEMQDSVRLTKVLHQQPVTCTLEECFDLHTKEEELGADDAWLCPHCHKRQQGTLKKLNFFNLPDVLVLHLKRFHITNGRRTKLCTRVEFPVNGLDMSKHIER